MGVVLSCLVGALTGTPETELSPQTEVFFNARLALRSHAPSEALKLWLLRNSLRQRGERSAHDADFHSVVWASLGELGLCPDGFFADNEGGAGLWTVALHNWLLATTARAEPTSPSPPFEAFQASQQQRLVSLHDVLDLDELRSVSFAPTACAQPQAALADLGLPPAGNLSERLQVGYVLQSFLHHAQFALDQRKVRQVKVIQARLFDLNLELTRLAALEARRRASAAQERALEKGVGKNALPAIRAAAEAWPSDSPEARFLRGTMTWSIEDWLALSPERSQALFARTKKFVDPQTRDALALAIVDALIARRLGAEVATWLSLLELDVTRRTAVVTGERGQQLLGLDEASGFKERGPVALHRGVWLLEQGNQREALRSFALALNAAKDSAESAATAGLARRWLTYVLGTYQANDELVAALKNLIPSLEYNAVIEDLVWKAALRADARSFERLVASARRGGTFDGRVARLRPLANGNAGELLEQLKASAGEEPHAMLRFVNTLLEQIEREEIDVRRTAQPLLRGLLKVLDTFGALSTTSKTQVRRAEEMAARAQAILTGLGWLADSAAGKGRALAPAQSAFAGNVRLAPSDALPWPFPAVDPVAPSPFRPLVLEPIEWVGEGSQLVFGWRIRE